MFLLKNLMVAALVMGMRIVRPAGGDVEVIAEAIARTDATPYEATMLAAIAWREGGFNLGIIGDGGRAYGTGQLHNAPRSVLTNADQAARRALYVLRYSLAHCPSAHLAAYAGAPCGSRTAKAISRDREYIRQQMFGGAL
jgi:hypothetical protein